MRDKLKKHRWDIAMVLSLVPAAAALIAWNRIVGQGDPLTTPAVAAGIAAIAITWVLVILFGRRKAREQKDREDREGK